MTPKSDDARAADPRKSSERVARWTLAVTSVAVLMLSLDLLVVTTALPVIGRDLDASFAEVEWMINAYALTLAVALFAGGALGERYGRRRLFVVGVVLFTVASAAAALAPNEGALIAARAIQGAGAAIVMPLSLTLITAAFPVERRGMALGVWAGVIGTGVGLGPLVGGAVTEALTWEWIFWINVPIGLATAALSLRFVRESCGARSPLDPIGLVLVSVGLLAIVHAVQGAADAGWTSGGTVLQLILGVALVLAFLLWERTTPTPMLPLGLLRVRTFAAANASGFLMGAALFSAGLLVAQYLQLAKGFSPVEAGVGMLPWTATPILLSPLAGRLADRAGNRPLMAAGLALHALGLAWFGLAAGAQAAYPTLVVPLLLAGIGISLVFPTVASAALGAAGPDRIGFASAMSNSTRQLGGAIGIAAVGAVFTANGALSTPDSIADGLQPALLAAAALSLAGALVALRAREPSSQPKLEPATAVASAESR